ncbi:cyclase family protein [Actinoplanes sp. NPDC051859]|uniref:cyclase family protein n=1 Tax=Actinoplanes sp. NPDC051859 TaxID=3363909 RepID=UPI0037AB5C2D
MRLDLVNLSHLADPATTCVYPGDPPFVVEPVTTIAEHGFRLNYLRQGELTGTHWSAPGHFTEGGALADELELQDLCRPAVKIDVRDRCTDDPDFTLSRADLLAWEHDHGPIPPESIVVLWTGWDAKWGTDAYYGYDNAGVLHQPGFSVDAVEWLIDTGRLGRRGGTGTDTFGPDAGTDTSYAVSKLVHREHRISVEVLANLAALPPTGAALLCGGQIVAGGTGSPALIYGVLP